MKTLLFNGLIMAGVVYSAYAAMHGLSNRRASPDRLVPLDYQPVAPPAIDGAHVEGAWRVSADDPRFGGISGLAMSGGRLLAISDSGTVMLLDPPGTHASYVLLHDLPAVAGRPDRKSGRDSEALLRDPAGRGWWVAFEQRHSLLLYDMRFNRLIERRRVDGRNLASNRGIEALYTQGSKIRGLAESLGVSDATRLPDGRLLLLKREIGLSGISTRLIARRLDLPFTLGALANPEAIASTPLAGGGARVWIMTDNDFRPGLETLLVAIDLP